MGTPLHLSDEAMLLCNRVLAALGGPPAKSQVEGALPPDALAVLCLFLLTQEFPCRIGFIGEGETLLAQVKGLIHVLGQAAYPMVTGGAPLSFQEVVAELGPSRTLLKPLFRYDQDGETIGAEPVGAHATLAVGPDGGPYTLAILSTPGPAPLEAPTDGLHPAVLLLG
jgi:hypothetical protein